jgi:hypothetical protein
MKPHAAHTADEAVIAEGVPSRPQRSPVGVRCRPSLRHVATTSYPLSSSPPRHRRTNKNSFSVACMPALAIAALAALYAARAYSRFVTALSRHLSLSLLE